MVCDAFEDVLEVDLWIESVELGRAEQRVDGCGAFTTGVELAAWLHQPVVYGGTAGVMAPLTVRNVAQSVSMLRRISS